MLKVNTKEARKTSRVSLFLTSSLTLRILLSSLYSAVLYEVKMPKYVLYTRKKKEKEVYQIPIWSVFPPEYKPPVSLIEINVWERYFPPAYTFENQMAKSLF